MQYQYCSDCGAPNYMDAVRCNSCKKSLSSEHVAGQAQAMAAAATLSGPLEYAGFGLRVGAFLIDFGVWLAVGIVMSVMLGILAAVGGDMFGLVSVLVQVVNFFAGMAYYILLESSPWQGTVGKKVLGLKVTDTDGERISIARAVGRYFGHFVSTIILFGGYLFPLFTEKRQALHDLLAGTLVVRANG
jgi:uncharacterized RDD family membrane protein YckC